MLENAVLENSLLILLIVIACIIGVTGNLYTVIAMILDAIHNKKEIINLYILTNSLFWCIIMIGKVVYLVSLVSNTAEEVSFIIFYFILFKCNKIKINFRL